MRGTHTTVERPGPAQVSGGQGSGRPPVVACRAFSIVELLLSIAVIVVLIGLLSVAVSGAFSAARSAADTQLVQNLASAASQFKSDHSFNIPLVKDNNRARYPSGFSAANSSVFRETHPVYEFGGNNDDRRVSVFSDSTAERNATDRDYLRGSDVLLGSALPAQGDYRFSEYSLAYYLAGALPASVDGQDGPGLKAPNRSGGFDRDSAMVYEPYFDLGDPPDLVGLQQPEDLDTDPPIDPLEGRYELRDRAGKAVRYYRWLPDDVVSNINDLNVPLVVAGENAEISDITPNTYAEIGDPRIRAAAWAIIAAGPDGVFGDPATEEIQDLIDATGIDVENPATPTPGEIQALVEAARLDNKLATGQ
ncbi:MAG: type II secretion system protein [Planctomycetota bacterium]